MTKPEGSVADLTEAFEYLDGLRDSGATNMYAGSSYLERDMSLPREDARKVLSAWMATFDPEKSAETRATAALAD